MEMYRKIARIENEDDFSDMIDELCDRFGDVPRSAMSLCRIALLRSSGVKAGMKKIDEREKEIVFCADSPDVSAVRALSQTHPGDVRMTLGATPAITVRKPRKSGGAVEFAIGILDEYLQNVEKNRQNAE